MASLLTLTQSQPQRTLKPGEALITEGDDNGELYILERGKLSVERDGVVLATIIEPGAMIGEMSVLLGKLHTATVRAETDTQVRVIENALSFLERTPIVAITVATLVCERLDATSALLVELRQKSDEKPNEQGMLSRIFAALTTPPKPAPSHFDAHE
jgi:CRP-like cAMP-binding protein